MFWFLLTFLEYFNSTDMLVAVCSGEFLAGRMAVSSDPVSSPQASEGLVIVELAAVWRLLC